MYHVDMFGKLTKKINPMIMSTRGDQMKVVGLTGGIGSGKSEVAKVFMSLGFPVVFADAIGKELLKKGSLEFEKVVQQFGREILDDSQEIDRKKLADIVFCHPDRLEVLNQIIHPKVFSEVERRVGVLKDMGHKVGFVESALLVETGYWKRLDALIVVIASEEQRIARVRKRDDVSEDEVRARMARQSSDLEKMKAATYVIENNGTIEELRVKSRMIAFDILESL